MEKMTWSRPMAVAEQFMANEYISACGDGGTVYRFVCNAGYLYEPHTATKGYGIFKDICGCGVDHGNIVPEGTYRAGKGKWYVTDANGKSLMNGYDSYSPCGGSHEAPSNQIFTPGFMDNLSTWGVKEEIPVMTWAGENNDNIHCTTALDINSWETVKS